VGCNNVLCLFCLHSTQKVSSSHLRASSMVRRRSFFSAQLGTSVSHDVSRKAHPGEHPSCSMLTTTCRSRSSLMDQYGSIQHPRIVMNVRDCHVKPGNDCTQIRPLGNCRLPRNLATHTASNEKNQAFENSIETQHCSMSRLYVLVLLNCLQTSVFFSDVSTT
jgi:hypothetical protein